MLFKSFFPEHRLKCSQYLLLVFLAQHVSKFGHFLALFRAADKFLAHNRKLNSLILVDVASDDLVDRLIEVYEKLVVHEADSTEFVRADRLLAHDFMLYQIFQVERLGAGHTFDQIGGQHFQNQG